MNKLKTRLKSMAENVKKKQEVAAKRAILKEVLNDMYENRGEIYKLNFVRGILFGLGSALGGTIILAIIVFILSQVLGTFLGDDWLNALQDSVNQ